MYSIYRMIKTRNFHKKVWKILKSLIYLKVTYHKKCLQWIVSSMKKYNKNFNNNKNNGTIFKIIYSNIHKDKNKRLFGEILRNFNKNKN